MGRLMIMPDNIAETGAVIGGLGRNRKIPSLPHHASLLFNVFFLGTPDTEA
jgi:hypothetical protein